ncbi:MAG: hypothetical protein VX218_06345, partial [Pseudomonadota bacterium]|nr:hypothetical protein [Pseudomonadota bacterium]
LQGVSQDFLTAARNNASSLAQYQRDVALVARYVDGGIAAAQDQIDYAKLTLDAQNATVALLGSIDATLSGGTSAAVLTAAANAASTSTATGTASTVGDLGAKIDALRTEMEQLRTENNAGHAATAGNTGAVKRHLDNVTTASGGDAISVLGAS